jgi:predicted nucleic acid-binding protein
MGTAKEVGTTVFSFDKDFEKLTKNSSLGGDKPRATAVKWYGSIMISGEKN